MVPKAEANLSSAFDVRVRVIECANCGAPVTHVPAGGQVTCEYCDALLTLLPRHSAEPVGPTLGGPTPGATFDYVPSAEHDDRVRATLAAGGFDVRLDLEACAPPDLARLGKPAHASAWKNERIPALRPQWEQALQKLRQDPEDEATALRVYWLASRLSEAYAYVSALQSGQEAHELQLRRRAVLETALGLLEDTDFGHALRCRLARAASQVGDPSAARAWLAPCDPYPASVELDGQLRLAMASIHACEKGWKGMLGLLGSAESPMPIHGTRPSQMADCYRIHAYEMLGNNDAWSTTLRHAMRRNPWPAVRGVCQTYELAPRASGRVLTYILLRIGLVLGAVVGLVVALALFS